MPTKTPLFRLAAFGALGATLLATGCGGTNQAASSSSAGTAGPTIAATSTPAPAGAPAASQQSQAKSPSAKATFPLTISADGSTLTFDKPPKILVDQYEAVYPVAAAGGNRTGNVVAVTDDANEPIGPSGETLEGVPRLSTFQSVSREVIIGQKPDLVITHGYPDNAMTGQLAAQGIKTMIVNTCWDGYAAAHGGRVGFDAIYDDITKISQLLGTEDYANQTLASLKQTVASVQQKSQGLTKQKVVLSAGIFSGSFFIYGPPSIANTQLETLGMTNAFSDLTKRGDSVSPEAFVARNPDFIVLGYDPASSSAQKAMQDAMAVPGFSTMTAVQRHHVLVLSDTFLLGRAVDGLQMLYEAIAAAK